MLQILEDTELKNFPFYYPKCKQESLIDMLGKNACCQTVILIKAGHDFPTRNSKQLNAVLNDFLLGKTKENKACYAK